MSNIVIKANEITKIRRAFLKISNSKVIYSIQSQLLFSIRKNKLILQAIDKNIATLKKEFNIINNNHIDTDIVIYSLKFFDIIKELENKDINITVEDTKLFIRYSYEKLSSLSGKMKTFKYETLLVGGKANDFLLEANSYNIDCNDFIRVNKKKFFEALKDCLKYVEKMPFKEVLKGVYIEFENNRLNLTATDGRKLSTYTIDCEGALLSNGIVKTEAIDTLLKTIDKINSDDDFYFNIIDNKFIVNDDVVLISNCIEGNYPNYRALFNNIDIKSTIQINDTKVLNKALRTINKSLSRSKRIICTVKNNLLILSCDDTEVSSSICSIEVVSDNDYQFVINYSFVKELIANKKSININVLEDKLFVINDDVKYLIMQMSIENEVDSKFDNSNIDTYIKDIDSKKVVKEAKKDIVKKTVGKSTKKTTLKKDDDKTVVKRVYKRKPKKLTLLQKIVKYICALIGA